MSLFSFIFEEVPEFMFEDLPEMIFGDDDE